MNIYKGMLLIPVRIKAEDTAEALSMARAAATESRKHVLNLIGAAVAPDTYTQAQASIELEPIVVGSDNNVVTIVPADPGHTEHDCPRVTIRMGCYACGYPDNEARYPAPDFNDIQEKAL